MALSCILLSLNLMAGPFPVRSMDNGRQISPELTEGTSEHALILNKEKADSTFFPSKDPKVLKQRQNWLENLRDRQDQKAKPLNEGGINSGGGDSYVVRFMITMSSEVYPWFKLHQANVEKIIPSEFFVPEDLFKAADPTRMVSQDKVFESCRDSKQGAISDRDREVEFCYDAEADYFRLSRTFRSQPGQPNPSFRGLVLHELLRRLGLEGDQYEISKQLLMDGLDMTTVNLNKKMAAWIKQTSCRISPEKFAADLNSDFVTSKQREDKRVYWSNENGDVKSQMPVISSARDMTVEAYLDSIASTYAFICLVPDKFQYYRMLRPSLYQHLRKLTGKRINYKEAASMKISDFLSQE